MQGSGKVVATIADEKNGAIEQVRCEVSGEKKEGIAEVVGGRGVGPRMGRERGVEGVGVGE